MADTPSGWLQPRLTTPRERMWPWRFLLVATVILSGATVILFSLLESTPPSALPIRGADISFTLQEEAIGRTLSSNGETAQIEQILADHGSNYVRLRVWVDPAPGTSDLKSALTLAQRAKSQGLKVLLNLHYSDSWADRRSQQTPSAWRGQEPEMLRETLRSYTRDVVAAFADQGTPVDMIQIGNEVTCGILWPTGSLCGPGAANWDNFAELVRSGAEGAKEGAPGHPPYIMVHIDTGGDFEGSAHFFDNLVTRGVEFDLIGLTYYPFWNGPLSSLEHNLDALVHRYGKDIVIAETAYPWTLNNPGPSVIETADALPDTAEFPATPEGQAAYFQALNRLLQEVPEGHGVGFFVWEPGWLPGVPAAPGVGTTHGNLTLFDYEGRGLPALEVFQPDGRFDG